MALAGIICIAPAATGISCGTRGPSGNRPRCSHAVRSSGLQWPRHSFSGLAAGGLHSSSTARNSSTRRRPLQPAAAAPAAAQAAADQLAALGSSGDAALASLPPPQLVATLAEGLETPVQLIYLLTLLGFLSVGAYLVVRQVLIRRELEEAAKVLGDRIRAGQASAEDYFELGVILLRKKLFTQATKNLERAKKEWDGEPEELAQVHNALGYAYFNLERVEPAVAEYRAAVSLQPGYVTAWNNLGDAYERRKQYKEALAAYQEALAYAPGNKVAQSRADFCRTRLERLA